MGAMLRNHSLIERVYTYILLARGIGRLVACKMCGVVHRRSWQGAAARPRCIPPACGSVRGSTPFQSHSTVSPVDRSQGDFALPAPIDVGAFLPPRPLTISWRPTLRGLDAPTVRRLDAASASALNPIRVRFAAPEPLAGPGDMPLYLHRTMHKRLPA